ncbi:U6 snRNA-associated Sm-like protein LSm5 [Schistocerca gregaria]|uniref:U6 snRNA-associated Sm-like protein LSm5 n=1 Tax=Schistocerca gregaria TaxID=7010 RepID=UPI00211DB16A|nr:U6 snRNA-associated Sm-like protein LSm5 [Schistocerca gregaria]
MSVTSDTNKASFPFDPQFLPLTYIDRQLKKRVWIIMRSEKELLGTLMGFDEFINLILEDVIEFDVAADGTVVQNRIPSILLNGTHISMIVPEGLYVRVCDGGEGRLGRGKRG